jgi:hypothetical protein
MQQPPRQDTTKRLLQTTQPRREMSRRLQTIELRARQFRPQFDKSGTTGRAAIVMASCLSSEPTDPGKPCGPAALPLAFSTWRRSSRDRQNRHSRLGPPAIRRSTRRRRSGRRRSRQSRCSTRERRLLCQDGVPRSPAPGSGMSLDCLFHH